MTATESEATVGEITLPSTAFHSLLFILQMCLAVQRLEMFPTVNTLGIHQGANASGPAVSSPIRTRIIFEGARGTGTAVGSGEGPTNVNVIKGMQRNKMHHASRAEERRRVTPMQLES